MSDSTAIAQPYRFSHWQVSTAAHALVITFIVVLALIKAPSTSQIEVPIQVPLPMAEQNLQKPKKQEVVLKSVNTAPPTQTTARPVFGASRNSLTADPTDTNAIDAKLGNTLAKSTDNEKLKASDADSLPTPTDEYLVSEMPAVLNEIRPEYPPEAREKRLEGVVVAALLIDQLGAVREVQIIEGAEIFRTVALVALRKFRFRPARVDNQAVAVRIRYSLKFKLEY